MSALPAGERVRPVDPRRVDGPQRDDGSLDGVRGQNPAHRNGIRRSRRRAPYAWPRRAETTARVRSASSSWASGLPTSVSPVAQVHPHTSSLKPGAEIEVDEDSPLGRGEPGLFLEFAGGGDVRRFTAEVQQPCRQLPQPPAQRMAVLVDQHDVVVVVAAPGRPPRRSARPLRGARCCRAASGPRRRAARKSFRRRGFRERPSRTRVQPRAAGSCSSCATLSWMLDTVRVAARECPCPAIVLRPCSPAHAPMNATNSGCGRVGRLFSSGCAWVPTMNGWTSAAYSTNSTRCPSGRGAGEPSARFRRCGRGIRCSPRNGGGAARIPRWPDMPAPQSNPAPARPDRRRVAWCRRGPPRRRPRRVGRPSWRSPGPACSDRTPRSWPR